MIFKTIKAKEFKEYAKQRYLEIFNDEDDEEFVFVEPDWTTCIYAKTKITEKNSRFLFVVVEHRNQRPRLALKGAHLINCRTCLKGDYWNAARTSYTAYNNLQALFTDEFEKTNSDEWVSRIEKKIHKTCPEIIKKQKAS